MGISWTNTRRMERIDVGGGSGDGGCGHPAGRRDSTCSVRVLELSSIPSTCTGMRYRGRSTDQRHANRMPQLHTYRQDLELSNIKTSDHYMKVLVLEPRDRFDPRTSLSNQKCSTVWALCTHLYQIDTSIQQLRTKSGLVRKFALLRILCMSL